MIAIIGRTSATVTVSNTEVCLKIQGAKKDFPKIIEQMFWTMCGASDQSIKLLETYNNNTDNGKVTRKDKADTLFTGVPLIKKIYGTGFTVNFSNPIPETHPPEETLDLAKRNECWKVMAGVAIVASGYPVPPRPERNSGLEGGLDVLRELFQRGCYKKDMLLGFRPVLAIPVVGEVKRDQLRTIEVTAAQEGAQDEKNAVYWHFIEKRSESFDEIGKRPALRREVSQNGRTTFVGWAPKVGFTGGKEPDVISLGGRLDRPPH